MVLWRVGILPQARKICRTQCSVAADEGTVFFFRFSIARLLNSGMRKTVGVLFAMPFSCWKIFRILKVLFCVLVTAACKACHFPGNFMISKRFRVKFYKLRLEVAFSEVFGVYRCFLIVFLTAVYFLGF